MNIKTLKIMMVCSFMLTSCYFFKKRAYDGGDQGGSISGGVIGDDLGAKAGGPDEAELQNLYSLTSSHMPANVRPDPDLFFRRLLLQFREEGSHVAREIGKIENYRPLLGGASDDFAVVPQESYDATSLLAMQKVAETTCKALVAPDIREHPTWRTILPNPVSNVTENLRFMLQRFTGRPNSSITDAQVNELDVIFDTNVTQPLTYDAYVQPCVAIIIDLESLLL